MAQVNDSTGNGAQQNGAAQSGDQRQFMLRHLYLKDLSFESPNSPATLQDPGSRPDIKMNLKTSHRELGNDRIEVILHVSAHATSGERTLFLIEVDQAGVFEITGCAPEEQRMLVGIACPSTLFPYAREAISSLVSRGGFPNLVLQHVDFAALYAQNAKQQGAEA